MMPGPRDFATDRTHLYGDGGDAEEFAVRSLSINGRFEEASEKAERRIHTQPNAAAEKIM